jgi:hypothetical protein
VLLLRALPQLLKLVLSEICHEFCRKF